jgi:formate hydrogenlyase transcriptional activator
VSANVDGPIDRATSEIRRLERCINDLVSVLSLPAVWTGHDLSRVAGTLLDVLVPMLDLDFAYLRTRSEPEFPMQEWARFSVMSSDWTDADGLGRALGPHLDCARPGSTPGLTSAVVGGHSVSLAIVQLGIIKPAATFVAGSRRLDFPTETQRLVLQVSTNQAAIALMEAQRVTRLQEEANERLRHREQELRTLVDFVPHLLGAVSPDGQMLLMNRAATTYLGTPLEDGVAAQEWRERFYHPDDRAAMQRNVQRALAEGVPQEGEARIRRHDGEYRWFLVRHEALRDDRGGLIRLYAAATDIHGRKAAEDRMRSENQALREEIDRASMFEEIVGVSPALRSVLTQVAQVATTDSTVLITGETGTGKELVARAIHKRSPRSARAFITVNCAALPTSLVTSELFGHEKGAFTGAVQSRQGRFELADGGTIFLDEIGELPLEAQLMLLRVLQEREFERVGGSRPIRTDVRVLAATNQNLADAISQKSFRADLYYRLNVFPIEMPSLRERRTDIPLLVEYFSHRIARRMGKRSPRVDAQTVKRLEGYSWPGNVRELQNIVERGMIGSEAETLVVHEGWLADPAGRLVIATDKPHTLADREREAIESALTASQGRVAGPFGAAKRLGIPATTLESKIKSLGLDKRRFKQT